MKPLNIHDLRKGFSRHVRTVAAGQELLISRRGVPVARLVPIYRGAKRKIGRDAGTYTVPSDFRHSFPLNDRKPVAHTSPVSIPDEGAQ